MSEEQAKKNEKKDKESPELKEELTEEELEGLSGGGQRPILMDEGLPYMV